MRRSRISFVFGIVIFLIISGCTESQQASIQPTLSPTFIETPEPTITPEPESKHGDFENIVIVNELERSYLLHIPPGLDDEQPIPVVFAFHGYTHSPKDMQTISQFDEIADQEQFLVVYPMGIELSWNTGWEGSPHFGYSLANNVNDIEFVRLILSDLEGNTNINPNRIYAVGFSQGGMLVYRLACEMSDTFAAIASVSGNHLISNCNPTLPVSIIHIHGLKDTSVKYSGGGAFDFPHVDEGIETWTELNNCTGSEKEEDEANGITHITYETCEAGTSVELYTTDSGTHSYYRIGIPASETIWEFFSEHPKR